MLNVSRGTIIYASLFFLFGLWACALTGCGLTIVKKGKQEIINAVDSYCNQVSLEERTALRNEVNAALMQKGNSIKITCQGDPN